MRNNYPIDKLYWQEFEILVILICQKILGIGAKSFSEGKDGGRDSYFEGSANCFPSATNPWHGKFVIQAKHTYFENASCSDNEFSGETKTSIISKELTRLKKIKNKRNFQNYLIFTNRKLSAGKHSELIDRIKKELSIDNVEVIGLEDITNYLAQNSEIVKELNLDKFELPFRFYEKDIQETILMFVKQKGKISPQKVIDISTDFENINKKEKNKLNKLSKEYFEFIKTKSLQHFSKLEKFLKDPKNKKYAKYYEDTVNDLQAKILVERKKYKTFEMLIEHIIDYILSSKPDEMSDCRTFIRVFLHFMYFQCDIGIKK